MTVIAIAEVDPQGMVHWSIPLVRVLALRVDSFVVWLTDFLEGRLARMQSGSGLFSGTWRVPLSWRVARPNPGWHCMAPSPIPSRTVLAELPDLPGRERRCPQLSMW